MKDMEVIDLPDLVSERSVARQIRLPFDDEKVPIQELVSRTSTFSRIA